MMLQDHITGTDYKPHCKVYTVNTEWSNSTLKLQKYRLREKTNVYQSSRFINKNKTFNVLVDFTVKPTQYTSTWFFTNRYEL